MWLLIARRVIRRVLNLLQKLRSRAWALRLRCERVYLMDLVIGRGNVLKVPVRSIGSGRLILGDSNSFGFAAAPRMGAGEILLQPRCNESRIKIGNGSAFSNNVSLVANREIVIGSNCRIGDQVAIYDCDFHDTNPVTWNQSYGTILPVNIGDNVWLGSRVMVL